MNNIPSMPQLGIYVSKIDPTLRITVTDVDIVDDDDESPDDELFYLVRWIEGEDESDMSAMEFELGPVEWHAFVESEQLVFERDLNRPGFPGECFICELRLPDHRFRWKHNKLFLLLPEEYGPAFPAIVDCYTSPPT